MKGITQFYALGLETPKWPVSGAEHRGMRNRQCRKFRDTPGTSPCALRRFDSHSPNIDDVPVRYTESPQRIRYVANLDDFAQDHSEMTFIYWNRLTTTVPIIIL
jgi:hypothetical protein